LLDVLVRDVRAIWLERGRRCGQVPTEPRLTDPPRIEHGQAIRGSHRSHGGLEHCNVRNRNRHIRCCCRPSLSIGVRRAPPHSCRGLNRFQLGHLHRHGDQCRQARRLCRSLASRSIRHWAAPEESRVSLSENVRLPAAHLQSGRGWPCSGRGHVPPLQRWCRF